LKLKITQVDAFAEKLFGGNPAAVIILDYWLEDELMQKIGMENNLSETAFLVKEETGYRIRWFTPTVEVDLCGHATLAAAKVLFDQQDFPGNELSFHSNSGILKVRKASTGKLTLDFPATPFEEVPDPDGVILKALRVDKARIFKGSFDYMAVIETQQLVEGLDPDFNLLSTLQSRGLVVTAKGDEADFVSRCFYPQSGINEDPATGSAHTMMTPYWAKVLSKNRLSAIQLSNRRANFDCELSGDRVLMSGNAIVYMTGEIEL
jgi:PhzF family phenazine biosynthesis protein